MKRKLAFFLFVQLVVLLLASCTDLSTTTTFTTASTPLTTDTSMTKASATTTDTTSETALTTLFVTTSTETQTTNPPTTVTIPETTTRTTETTTMSSVDTTLVTTDTTAAIEIADADDLVQFINSGATDCYYYLSADIDMYGIVLTGSNLVFAGTFDGEGHTIRNVVVNSTAQKMGFLFKELLDGAIVRNVTFADSVHNGGGTNESCAFLSAFARGGARFENLTFINVSVQNTGSYAALVFGDVYYASTANTIYLENITVINDENNGIAAKSYIGGLIGSSRQAVDIFVDNVYFSSSVSASEQASGSIMGRFNATNIHLQVSNVVI